MYKVKAILIFAGVALIVTLFSLFVKIDTLLIGDMPLNTIGRGFPFHFYEIGYSDRSYNNPVWQKLLPIHFFGNIFAYLSVIASVWYLIKKVLKERNWWPLTIVAVTALTSLMINVGASQSCGAGFPIEFYPKCIGVDATWSFILFGLFFDILFWFGLFAILIVGFCKLFSYFSFKNFFIYKDVWFVFISAWITIVTIFLLASILHISEFAGGIVIAIVCAPFLSKTHHYFRKQNKNKGKKFFFSIVGYIALGISIGLVLISFSFNLFYKSGWFDFTDFGFILLSYPLNMIVKFQFNSDIFSKRIILYLISLANLTIIIFILDIFGAVCIKIYKNIFNFFVNNYLKTK